MTATMALSAPAGAEVRDDGVREDGRSSGDLSSLARGLRLPLYGNTSVAPSTCPKSGENGWSKRLPDETRPGRAFHVPSKQPQVSFTRLLTLSLARQARTAQAQAQAQAGTRRHTSIAPSSSFSAPRPRHSIRFCFRRVFLALRLL